MAKCWPLLWVCLMVWGCSDESSSNNVNNTNNVNNSNNVNNVNNSNNANNANNSNNANNVADMGQDLGTDMGEDMGPPPETQPVGVPPRPPTGAGEPPVVFWPKPTFAHPEVPYEFTMVAYDPEHEQLLYSLESAPAGMEIDGDGKITWQPEPSGTFEFTVLIDDGRGDPVRVSSTLAVDASKFLFVALGGSGDGTLASPMGDLYAAQSQLGDMDNGVLFVRGGTYPVAWNWEVNGVQSPLRGANGTADAPFEVRGYPGETVVIDCEEQGHGLWSYAATYVIYADLEVRRPSVGERAGVLLEGDNTVTQNVTVRDANWDTSNNCSGFLLRGDGVVCHRCKAFDNYDRNNPRFWNSANYLMYPEGRNQSIFIIDSYSENSGVGYKVKHAGNGQVFVHGNIDVGSASGYGGQDDDSEVSFNGLFNNDTGVAFAISDPNAFTPGAMNVHHNTIVEADRGVWVGNPYATEGSEFLDNVVHTTQTLGTAESDPLMMFVWPYTAHDISVLDFDRNCFSAPNSDAGFRHGNTQAGSFAAWQADGLDENSIFGAAEFEGDSYTLGTNSPCRSLSGVGAY